MGPRQFRNREDLARIWIQDLGLRSSLRAKLCELEDTINKGVIKILVDWGRENGFVLALGSERNYAKAFDAFVRANRFTYTYVRLLPRPWWKRVLGLG